MKEISYDNFTRKIGKIKSRKPLYGSIELTYRCSYNCVHCYCKNQLKKEFGFSFWKDILNQIRDLGGITLVLTGGEPVLHKDFLQIYKFAKKLGFLITIFTSGYNLNKEILDFLEDNPPFNIEITINSLDRENYEAITKKRRAFARAIGNVYEIKKRRLPLVLKCNGLRENKSEILKIKKFSEELLGKRKFKFDSLIRPGLDKEGEPKNHRLSAEEILDIEKSDPDMLRQWKKRINQHSPFLNPSGLYHCNSWLAQYFINPQGILQFCRLTKKYSTDLKKETFRDGFDRFLSVLNEKYKTDSKCIECEYKEYCCHCPPRAYLETGDEEAPVEYYCRLAKARKDFIDGFKTYR